MKVLTTDRAAMRPAQSVSMTGGSHTLRIVLAVIALISVVKLLRSVIRLGGRDRSIPFPSRCCGSVSQSADKDLFDVRFWGTILDRERPLSDHVCVEFLTTDLFFLLIQH